MCARISARTCVSTHPLPTERHTPARAITHRARSIHRQQPAHHRACAHAATSSACRCLYVLCVSVRVRMRARVWARVGRGRGDGRAAPPSACRQAGECADSSSAGLRAPRAGCVSCVGVFISSMKQIKMRFEHQVYFFSVKFIKFLSQCEIFQPKSYKFRAK